MNQEQLSDLKSEIDSVVNKWVSEILRDRLIHGTKDSKPSSLWDKLKQGMANWWYGPQGEKDNPYMWKNRFGGRLGVSESFSPAVLTLREYAEIKEAVDSVERVINEAPEAFEKLRIAQILRSAGEDLKAMLFDRLKDKVASVSPSPVSAPAVAPAGAPASQPAVAAQGSPPASADAKAQKKKKGATSPVTQDTSSQGKASTKAAGTATKPSSPAPKEQKARDTSKPSGSSAAAQPKQNAGEGDDVNTATSKNEQLIGYLQDDRQGRRYSLDDAVDKITSFFMSVESFRESKSLEKWWSGKVEEYIKDSQGKSEESGLDKIWNDLVVGDSMLDAIEKNTRIPKSEIKKMMVDHLVGRSPSKEDAGAGKRPTEQEEEEDSSLGLNAYFTTDGKADEPGVAIAKIERFLANPMAATGRETQPNIVEALATWWEGVKKKMSEASDKRDFLSKNMSEKSDDAEYVPPFASQIANVMNKSPKYVANLMRAHIRKKSNRQ